MDNSYSTFSNTIFNKFGAVYSVEGVAANRILKVFLSQYK